MDVGTATSQSVYAYQASLQAAPQAYTNPATAYAPGSNDSVAALPGASVIGSLTAGIADPTQPAQSQANAASPAPNPPAAADPSTFAGLNINPATSVLASLGSDTGGVQPAAPSEGGNAALAMAAYQAQQDYPGSASAAQAAPATATATTAADTSGQAATATAIPAAVPDPATYAYLQQQQSVQASINPVLMSMMA